MTHVVTQNCCNDATCVEVCPVDCIHPAPGEPGYATSELLYIDPSTCIDCGACVEVCPVDAIAADFDLTARDRHYLDINAEYYAGSMADRTVSAVRPRDSAAPARPERLKVAIVGSGPSAFYAAQLLLGRSDIRVEVTMIERLPFAGGLLRYGVAPDHQKTKSIEDNFRRVLRHRDLTAYFNVDVGRHICAEDLFRHHHAVLFATGSSADRRLGIGGEDLPGSHSAREFVAWYNAHPDCADLSIDLTHPRAVIVGTGNVALDIARILTTDVSLLQQTDIADHALAALSQSQVREVVLLGRRGPESAACTTPELLGLQSDPSVDITVAGNVPLGAKSTIKHRILSDYAKRSVRPGHRRITFEFDTTPMEVLGVDSVAGVRVNRRRAEASDIIDCGLVLRSIGYRGVPIPGLPFNEISGSVTNLAGRVVDEHSQPTGCYVVGWIKRGPTGVIGTNRFCAQETVESLLSDFVDHRLTDPIEGSSEFGRLLVHKRPETMSTSDWLTVDRYERTDGRLQGRPRVKVVDATIALR